jgi:hypothetical protein
MQQSKYYAVSPTDTRRQNRYIILAHVSDFVMRGWFFDPDLRNKTNYFCFDKIKNYFRERVDIRQMPFHYYTSIIKGDWELFHAAPATYRSPMISEAIQRYYIPDRFRDAIVICVQDNFALNTADMRMHQLLGSTLIAPLLNQFKVNFMDSVFWFDEIFDWDKYNQDVEDDPLGYTYPYETNRMKFFDRTIFNLECRRFI